MNSLRNGRKQGKIIEAIVFVIKISLKEREIENSFPKQLFQVPFRIDNA